MDNDIVIATCPDGDEIRLTALGIEVSHDNPKNLADGEVSGYTGPLETGFGRGNQKHVGTLPIRNLAHPKEDESNSALENAPVPSLNEGFQNIPRSIHWTHKASGQSKEKTLSATTRPTNPVPDSRLGLTKDEIALLRHHQHIANIPDGASSRVSSRASSQGLLLLDGASLVAMGRHFDRLIRAVQSRLDYLSEQAQIATQNRHHNVIILIANADAEIARFQSVHHQIDKLELELDKLRSLRDIVRDFRLRVEVLDRRLEKSCPSYLAMPRPQRQSQEESTERDLQAHSASSILGTSHPPSDVSTTWSTTSTEDTRDVGSEGSGDCCPLIEWKHHLVLEAVMTESYGWLHSHKSAITTGAYNQRGGTNSAQSSSSTNGSLSSTTKSSISSWSNASGAKRPSQDGEFPLPDEDQDGNKRPRRSGTTLKDENRARRYACPFFKRNPRKHSERGSCTGPGFNSISHLKEHLYRCHMAPVQCPRCWLVVGDERGLELHLGSDTQCQKHQKEPVEGICSRKLKLLKSKKRLTLEAGDEARWTDVFRILFPGFQPIPSPYYELENDSAMNRASSSADSRQRSDFSEYSQTRLPGLIEAHVEHILQKELQPLEARIKLMVQDITRKCLSDLVRDWQAEQTGSLDSSQRSDKETENLPVYSGPRPPNTFQWDFFGTEAHDSNTCREDPAFNTSDVVGFDNHFIATSSSISNDDWTHTGEWIYPAADQSRMEGSVQGNKQVPAFFCFENPPHSEPQEYTGNGKNREDFSRDSQTHFCSTCFPYDKGDPIPGGSIF